MDNYRIYSNKCTVHLFNFFKTQAFENSCNNNKHTTVIIMNLTIFELWMPSKICCISENATVCSMLLQKISYNCQVQLKYQCSIHCNLIKFTNCNDLQDKKIECTYWNICCSSKVKRYYKWFILAHLSQNS